VRAQCSTTRAKRTAPIPSSECHRRERHAFRSDTRLETAAGEPRGAILERLPMTDERRITRTHFQIANAVRASISHDGLVLLDVQGGVVLASNAIGARIWQLIEARLDGVEIASRLAREYDVPIERAAHDVVAFLRALEAQGLVTAEPAC
jgi:hypothetical protein